MVNGPSMTLICVELIRVIHGVNQRNVISNGVDHGFHAFETTCWHWEIQLFIDPLMFDVDVPVVYGKNWDGL